MPRQPPNRVTFPMDFRHRIYLCMHCDNHVLNVPRNNCNLVIRVRNVLGQNLGGMEGGVICDAGGMAVNLRFGSLRDCSFRNQRPVVDVYCNQCRALIGERLTFYRRVEHTPSREIHTYGGPALLYLGSMVYWDGRSTIYAKDFEPVDGDEDELVKID